MRRTAKVSPIPVQLRSQIVSLRKTGMSVMAICERLGIDKSSERNAVSQICAEPELRRYQVGIESVNNGSSHRIKTGHWA
jgi:hypothetical protein